MENSDIDKIISLEKSVIHELQEIKEAVLLLHRNCNIANTTGSSVSALGFASIVSGAVLAPASGGASLYLTAAGIGASIAGGLTNIGTHFVNQSQSGELISQLDKALDRRLTAYHKVGQKMKKHLDSIEPSSIEYIKRYGSGAWKVASAGMKLDKAITTGRTLHFLKVNKDIYGSSISAILSAKQMGPAGSTIFSLRNALNSGLSRISVQLGAKTLFIGLGGVCVLWDTYTLIRSWTTSPDVCRQIDEICDSIKEKIHELRNVQRSA